MFKDKVEKDYEKGNTKRDAHSKCTGLLKGYFVVDKNLNEKYGVGIFKPSKVYPALIRSVASCNLSSSFHLAEPPLTFLIAAIIIPPKSDQLSSYIPLCNISRF